MEAFSEDVDARFTARHQAILGFCGLEGSVLDVGCFNGWFEKYAKCSFVVGVDVDLKAKGGNFIRASASFLPFRRGAFSSACMFDVLEHLPSERGALIEAYRVLLCRGLLYISVPNRSSLSVFLDPAFYMRGHRHYSLLTLYWLLNRNGFTVTSWRRRGGVVEAFSVLMLYLFKRFGFEVPFRRRVEHLRALEYSRDGFETLFVKAAKL